MRPATRARADFDCRGVPEAVPAGAASSSTTAFLQRVVPAILENTPDVKVDDPNDLVQSFLEINGELRRKNAETDRGLRAARPRPRCCGAASFQQLGNSQVESAFADHRTYFYKGKEVDQQVHLGFDLARHQRVPIVAANRGKVLYAD